MQIVLTTVADLSQAEALARKIVEARLAGCVQVLPAMTSIYIWKGRIENEAEHLLLIKTLPEKWQALREFITEHHAYDVPEIVAIDAAAVSEPYRAWLIATIGDE